VFIDNASGNCGLLDQSLAVIFCEESVRRSRTPTMGFLQVRRLWCGSLASQEKMFSAQNEMDCRVVLRKRNFSTGQTAQREAPALCETKRAKYDTAALYNIFKLGK